MFALAGSGQIFETIRPVSYIECAPENTDEMTAFFKNRDYRLFHIDRFSKEHELDRFNFNTLAKPAERCD